MCNLWRTVILFILPGAIWSGGTAGAFLRLTDFGMEPLRAVAAGMLLWCIAGGVSAAVIYRMHNPDRFYYRGMLLCAIGFTAFAGIVRLCGGNGWLEGVAGMIVSGAAMGFAAHAAESGHFSKLDRISWVVGVFLGGYAWLWGCETLRLNWMETQFFYLGELLLICWCMHSPFTRRGSRIRRWSWRIILLIAAAGAFHVSPTLSYGPWNGAPDVFPDGLWNGTFVTSQGSCFSWVDPDDNSGIFAPDGRLIMWQEADLELQGAMSSLLSLPDRADPEIKLIAPPTSVLPETLKILTGKSPRWYQGPESLAGLYGCGGQLPWSKYIYDSEADEYYDLLLITVLPENHYDYTIERFWQFAAGDLRSDAVVAVPSNILKNPVLFKLLHEQFSFCGVLPQPWQLWVFANRKLELSRKQMQQKLKDLYGEDFTAEYADFMLSDNAAHWVAYPAAPDLQIFRWGHNQRYCSWTNVAAVLLLIVLWRIIRLFGERRNIMYNYWNSAENGFAGMGVFLLVLTLLVTRWGIYNLAIGLYIACLGIFWLRLPSGGVWGALAGLLLIAIAPAAGKWAPYLYLAAVAQNLLYSRHEAVNFEGTVRERLKLLNAFYLGMILAVLFMGMVWAFSLSLPLVWCLLLVARLPGIWQKKYNRVY